MNAMNAWRNMSTNNVNAGKSMEKLSSGLRINRAGDDAAGLAISEKMRGQIRGLDQASRNAQDGISMVQTAEGALNETHSILQRMRELAVQASNDTNTTDDRASIQTELNHLTSEITRIGNTTEFNTKKVINGDMSDAGQGAVMEKQTLTFDDTTDFTANTAHADVKLEIGGEAYTIKFSVTADAGTAPAIDKTNKTVTVGISDSVAQIGKDVAGALNILAGQDSGLALNQFTITTGTDDTLTIEAKSTGAFAGSAGAESIKLTSGLLVDRLNEDANGKDGKDGKSQLQIGANTDQQFTIDINDMRAKALKISSTDDDSAHPVTGAAHFTKDVDNQLTDVADTVGGTDEYALDVSSSAYATAAVTVIDAAIKSVSDERSKLGAYQNRLEHTIANLGTSSENLTSAESRVRDVDMAKEMMNFSKNNILSQAAQAMLAQANQQPQGVLQLLR